MENSAHGLIDNWLRNIKDVRRYHQARIDSIKNENEKLDLMCELTNNTAFDPFLASGKSSHLQLSCGNREGRTKDNHNGCKLS